MSKSDLIYQLCLVALIIVLGGWFFKKGYDPTWLDYTMDPGNRTTTTMRERAIAYWNETNKKYGTTDLIYVPCPAGHDCSRIVPLEINREYPGRVVVDECSGKECRDNFEAVLDYHEIFFADQYLAERKLSP